MSYQAIHQSDILTEKVSSRGVVQQVYGLDTADGAGVNLRRYIASPELEQLDPFLLLDVFHSDKPEDYMAGFPIHPHRGFETVTYLVEGRLKHKDSAGHEGIIKTGGVQWMTAGRGIEHSEMPEQHQGLLYGLQLWVNLPAAQKMIPPRYQELGAEMITEEYREDGVKLRVIAGETSYKSKGPIVDIAAEPLYLDVSLQSGKRFLEPIKAGYNAFVFVLGGELSIVSDSSADLVTVDTLAVLGQGDNIAVQARTDSRFLLVAGKPFNEPVARSGPFVMNSATEIRQAFSDYRKGLFNKVTDEKELV